LREFAHALHLQPESVLCRALFNSFDKTKSDSLTFRKFVMTLSYLNPAASLEDKIRFSFDLCDLNKDGFIDTDELLKMLLSAVRDPSTGIELSEEQIRQVCRQTFESVDTDRNGVIDFAEYQRMVHARPGMLYPYTVDVRVVFSPFMLHHNVGQGPYDTSTLPNAPEWNRAASLRHRPVRYMSSSQVDRATMRVQQAQCQQAPSPDALSHKSRQRESTVRVVEDLRELGFQEDDT